MIFTAVFTFSSCGNGKDKSKIIIISEEIFKSEIKTKGLDTVNTINFTVSYNYTGE